MEVDFSKDLRGAQSKSARPRTSVAQHSALLLIPRHKGNCRSVRGMALATVMVAPAMAATMVEVRILDLFGWL